MLVLAAVAVTALAACGQKGNLFLPTDPAAAQRATLPQSLRPSGTAPEPPTPALAPAAPEPMVPASAAR